MWDVLLCGAFSLDLVRRLADHEGLGLCEIVRGEHADGMSVSCSYNEQIKYSHLVLVVLDRVVALGSKNEISWDQLGALVQKLKERVLCVGRGLSEDDRSGGVFDIVTTAGDGLAVRFHGQLLEVGRESVEVLVETTARVSK